MSDSVLDPASISQPFTPATSPGEPASAGESAQPDLLKNELSRPAGAPTENSRVEKVIGAGAKIFEKFGIPFKPGRGRPRKDGSPKKSDVPIADLPIVASVTPIPAVAAGTNPNTALIDSARATLFRKSVCAAVKGSIGILKKIVRIKADAAGIDKAFTEKSLAAAEPEPGAMDDFCESLDAVLKKHNCEPKHSEEVALGINSIRIVSPFVMLISTFNAEIARKRAAEKPQQPAPAKP